MGDCFQVYVFGQNAMAVCAITIIKTVVFEWFHFFHLFSKLVSAGMVSGVILTPFCDLGVTFSDF